MGRQSTCELRADFSRRRSSREVFRHHGGRGNLHSSNVLMSAQRIKIPRATSYSMGSGREAKRWRTAKPLCGRELSCPHLGRIHCLGFTFEFASNLGRAARDSHLPSEVAPTGRSPRPSRQAPPPVWLRPSTFGIIRCESRRLNQGLLETPLFRPQLPQRRGTH